MILSNTTLAGLPFTLVARADGTAITSATITGYYLLDGGTQATLSGSYTHEGNGQWSINTITTTEMAGTVIGLLFTDALSVPVHYTIFANNEPRRGVAVTGFPFLMLDRATSAPITSGTVNGYRLIDGGTQTALTNSCVHEGNGQWSVNLTAAEMDGRVIGFLFTHSSGVNVGFTIPTVEASSILGISGAAGTPTIKTGLSTFWPMCFAKSRNNILIGVNGIDRGIRWDGITSSAEPLGIDAPTVAPTIAHPVGGGATVGDYICGYRWIDDELPVPAPSSLSPVTEVTVVGNDKFEWTALQASSQTRVVKYELWRSTSDQATTVYKVATFGHNGSITSSASTGVYTTTAPHNLVVGCTVTVAGVTGGSNYNASNIEVTAVTATTFTAGTGTGSGTGGTWQATGYLADTATDATLQANDTDDQMRILAPNGDLESRRFVPPPNYKPYAAFYVDRLWLAGVVPYTLGTVSTNATTTLTGSGTNWPTTLAGRYVAIQGETGLRLIASVGSTTSITLDVAASSTQSGVEYAIIPSPEERNQVYYSEVDEPESMSSLNVVSLQNNTGDDDEVTGLMPMGPYLYVLKNRHIYRLSTFAQPKVDTSIVLVSSRGCVNNRCWALLDDISYLMDEQGVYQFVDGSVRPISTQIRDLFRDGTIDWSKSKWFSAQADPVEETVRFYVNYTTDTTNTRPIRWIEYNVRDGQWHTGSGVMEIGASCLAKVNDRTRVLAFSQGDVVYLLGQGLSDHVTSATRGTATAATSTTLTDSTASFAATVIGAPVAIISGTGKGQIRRISARTSTVLTVSAAFSTTPDTTSVYLIGAIKWNVKTGLFQFVNSDIENRRDMRIVFEPTTGTASLDIRRYLNHSTTAQNAELAFDRGDGLSIVSGDPDAVVDMKLTRSTNENASGFTTRLLTGRLDHDAQTDRFVAVELRGFQADYAIKVYRLELMGVVGGQN